MSTPDRILAQYKRAFQRIGESVLIRRYSGTGGSRTGVDTAVMARIAGYGPDELIGSVVQGDRKVICLVDTLSAILPLTTSDKVVVRGKELAIKGVDDNSRRVAGILIALELQVAG